MILYAHTAWLELQSLAKSALLPTTWPSRPILSTLWRERFALLQHSTRATILRIRRARNIPQPRGYDVLLSSSRCTSPDRLPQTVPRSGHGSPSSYDSCPMKSVFGMQTWLQRSWREQMEPVPGLYTLYLEVMRLQRRSYEVW